jgi:hypothetical protein
MTFFINVLSSYVWSHNTLYMNEYCIYIDKHYNLTH